MPLRPAVCAVLVAFVSAAQAAPRGLPAEVEAALDSAQVPHAAMAAFVQEVGAKRPLVAWQDDEPMNPASLMKLVTTYAALDLLGPAWTWTTPVWLQGSVEGGVLDGNLVIKGSGDPKLVPERLWLLLRRVQQLGVREIRGDIVLDRSAFDVPEQSPGDFDGEPRRAYNVRPDALLLNYKSVVMSFTPDPAREVARIGVDPLLPGTQIDASVPLSSGPCEDWRGMLKLDLSGSNTRFGGSFPAACGEKQWVLADPDPASYNARALRSAWTDLGGTLTGTVHDGEAPLASPSFEFNSPPLAEVVRDINKFSNNVMAQQLFLTLGLTQRLSGTPRAARAALRLWLANRLGPVAADQVVIDNGSGLSRDTRLSARLLARLLQSAWASPVMPELMASLPVAGIDGTLRHGRVSVGRAHLKTGSLRDVAAIAGYVLSSTGRRYVVVGIVNHASSAEARPALDALVSWVANGERRN